jgi:hypothetical protein
MMTGSAEGSGNATGSGSGSGAGSAAVGVGSGTATDPGEGSGKVTVPERRLIKLKVVTTPANAVVYLDGKKLGTTPNVFEIPRVDGKKGKLEIKLDRHVTSTEKIALDQGFERTITLKPKKRGGGNTGTGGGSGSGKGSSTNNGGGDNLIKPDDL